MSHQKHELYNVWRSIIAKTTNPNNDHYRLYGERGISVCSRWMPDPDHKYSKKGFFNFVEDVNPRPEGDYYLGRIDKNGLYCPENCKWFTRSEVQCNKRNYTLPTNRGSKNRLSKLTEEKVKEIKLLLREKTSYRELSKKYNVCVAAISQINTGRTWKHVQV